MCLKGLLFRCLSLLSLVLSNYEGTFITVDDYGGYENVVVAISPNIKPVTVQEETEFIYNIKDLFKLANKKLRLATKEQLYFKSISVLVPESWNSLYSPPRNANFETHRNADIRIEFPSGTQDNNPFTLQFRGCGEPGHFIRLTPTFLTEVNSLKALQLVREWSRFRYGMFEEHGKENSIRFPMTYVSGDKNTRKVTGCSSPYPWIIENPERCGKVDKDNDCKISLKEDIAADSSLMDTPLIKASSYCSEFHNWEAPTPHNVFCHGISTWELIQKSPDYPRSSVDNSFSYENGINFNIVKYVIPKIVLVIDPSLCNHADKKVYKTFKESMRRLIKDYFPVGSPVVVFFNDTQLHQEFITINDHSRRDLENEFNNLCKSSIIHSSLTPHIGKLIVNAQSLLSRGGTLIIIASGEHLSYNDIQSVITPENNALVSTRLITYPPLSVPLSRPKGTPLELDRVRHLQWYNILQGRNNDECDLTARLSLEATMMKITDELQHGLHPKKSLIYSKVHDDQDISLATELSSNGKLTIALYYCSILNYLPVFVNNGKKILFTNTSDFSYVEEDYFKKGNVNFQIIHEYNSDPHPRAVAIWFQSDSEPLTLETSVDISEPPNSNLTAIILRAYVHINSIPVLNAEVEATVIGPDQRITQLKLVDFGNGDPDIFEDDGVYSKYFTGFASYPGLYTYTVRVRTEGNAPYYEFCSVESFGSFYSDSSAADSDVIPPNRILDFVLETLQVNSGMAVFRWTPPGDDFDNGVVTSYRYQCSEYRNELNDAFRYSPVNSIVDSSVNFTRGYYRMYWLVPQENVVYFCALKAFDDAGNSNNPSNIVSVFLPSDQIPLLTTTSDNLTNTISKEEQSEGLSTSTTIIIAVVVTFVCTIILTSIIIILVGIKCLGYKKTKTAPKQHPTPSAPPVNQLYPNIPQMRGCNNPVYQSNENSMSYPSNLTSSPSHLSLQESTFSNESMTEHEEHIYNEPNQN